MVNELHYTSIALVLESWEQVRRGKNYEEVAGSLLFQHLFTKSPSSNVLFGFPIAMEPSSDDLLQSKRFKAHAVYMIRMLDSALNLLGPDIELLTEILMDLGVKHERYGVQPEMFVVMRDSLLVVLETLLPKEYFRPATREAWQETFDELCQDMIRAQTKKEKVMSVGMKE